MYYTPRDCPRACFWAGSATTEDDKELWLRGSRSRFVMCIESGWLQRLRHTKLYRYQMPEEPFVSMGHEGGHFTCHEAVEPLRVEPVGDLLEAIAAADVELRVMGRLGPMWRRVWKESTLEFSGTRLRNAVGHPEEFE
jgi:hypothetical protein